MTINIKHLELWLLRGEVFSGWIFMNRFGCVSLYWIVGEV